MKKQFPKILILKLHKKILNLMLFLFHSLYVRSYWLIIPWKLHTICGHITGISTDKINFREYYFRKHGNIGFPVKRSRLKLLEQTQSHFLLPGKKKDCEVIQAEWQANHSQIKGVKKKKAEMWSWNIYSLQKHHPGLVPGHLNTSK